MQSRACFTIEGKTYTYKAVETTLVAGKTTAYKLSVTKSGVELSSITLEDWDTTAPATKADIKADLTGTASAGGSGTEAIKGTAMSIWKKGVGNTGSTTNNAQADKPRHTPTPSPAVHGAARTPFTWTTQI